MCCDCNVSEDTYRSFFFNSEIHSEFKTNIWLQVLPNLPLQHVTVAASQAVRRQLDYSWLLNNAEMHIELLCPLHCRSVNQQTKRSYGLRDITEYYEVSLLWDVELGRHADVILGLRCSKMFDFKDVWHLAHLFQAENTGKEQASGLGASRQGDVMKCAPKIWQATMYSIH